MQHAMRDYMHARDDRTNFKFSIQCVDGGVTDVRTVPLYRIPITILFIVLLGLSLFYW